MKNTAITKRLSGLGGAKWEVYLKAKDLIAQGWDIIEMTIGEPDVPTPEVLVDAADVRHASGSHDLCQRPRGARAVSRVG